MNPISIKGHGCSLISAHSFSRGNIAFFLGMERGREGEYPLPIRWWSIKRRCTPLTCIPWSIHLPPPRIFSVKKMLFLFRFRRLAADKQKEVSCCGCQVFYTPSCKAAIKIKYSRVTNKSIWNKHLFAAFDRFAAETPALWAHCCLCHTEPSCKINLKSRI